MQECISVHRVVPPPLRGTEADPANRRHIHKSVGEATRDRILANFWGMVGITGIRVLISSNLEYERRNTERRERRSGGRRRRWRRRRRNGVVITTNEHPSRFSSRDEPASKTSRRMPRFSWIKRHTDALYAPLLRRVRIREWRDVCSSARFVYT